LGGIGVNLTFSLQVKEELTRVKLEKGCCASWELAGLLSPRGQAGFFKGNKIFRTSYAPLARRAYTLAKQALGIPAEIKIQRNPRGKAQFTVKLPLPGEKIQERLADFDRGLLRDGCCQRAYLRGVFLAIGSVNNPQISHHLEFFPLTQEGAQRLQFLLGVLGLKSNALLRRGKWVIYLKDREQIVHLLSLMGAHGAVLEYENTMIIKDMRNQANRLVNCETANLNKTVETGLRQAEVIRYLVDRVGWEGFPEGLKQIAALRLKYPEATLKELGEMMVPPLGKSGVNHRLRRLQRLYERLKGEGKSGLG